MSQHPSPHSCGMTYRLKYKVLHASSEDPEQPVGELLSHSSKTKGWSSARFCDYPQELGTAHSSDDVRLSNKFVTKVEACAPFVNIMDYLHTRHGRVVDDERTPLDSWRMLDDSGHVNRLPSLGLVYLPGRAGGRVWPGACC